MERNKTTCRDNVRLPAIIRWMTLEILGFSLEIFASFKLNF